MENAHAGHRQRLRDRVRREGLEALEPHEVVEYLLYSVIPRRDINPLAHALIDHFGNLRGVFGADAAQLVQVEGMPASAAEWLAYIGKAVLEYAAGEPEYRLLCNRRQTREYLEEFFDEQELGDFWMICLNSTGCTVRSMPIDGSPVWHDAANMRLILKQAMDCRAHTVILAQQREDTRLTKEDAYYTDLLKQALKSVGITLVESMILNPDADVEQYIVTLSERERMLAEHSPLLAHWMDEK